MVVSGATVTNGRSVKFLARRTRYWSPSNARRRSRFFFVPSFAPSHYFGRVEVREKRAMRRKRLDRYQRVRSSVITLVRFFIRFNHFRFFFYGRSCRALFWRVADDKPFDSAYMILLYWNLYGSHKSIDDGCFSALGSSEPTNDWDPEVNPNDRNRAAHAYENHILLTFGHCSSLGFFYFPMGDRESCEERAIRSRFYILVGTYGQSVRATRSID